MKKVADFLTALRENNNREWFTAHRAEYDAARAEFNALIEQLIVGVSGFDASVAGLTARDCCYRINRDTRFAKDKSPYKTHFGAFISAGGRNSMRAGYYFHVEPAGGGMVGGNIMCAGIYCPQPKVLRSIREEMEFGSAAFLEVLRLAGEAGLTVDRDNVLSRVPQGFPKDSPMAEYLRLKDVSIYRYFDNSLLLSPELYDTVLSAFHASAPFVGLVNKAVDLGIEN